MLHGRGKRIGIGERGSPDKQIIEQATQTVNVRGRSGTLSPHLFGTDVARIQSRPVIQLNQLRKTEVGQTDPRIGQAQTIRIQMTVASVPGMRERQPFRDLANNLQNPAHIQAFTLQFPKRPTLRLSKKTGGTLSIRSAAQGSRNSRIGFFRQCSVIESG